MHFKYVTHLFTNDVIPGKIKLLFLTIFLKSHLGKCTKTPCTKIWLQKSIYIKCRYFSTHFTREKRQQIYFTPHSVENSLDLSKQSEIIKIYVSPTI